MRISDWSSDVCSSDLPRAAGAGVFPRRAVVVHVAAKLQRVVFDQRLGADADAAQCHRPDRLESAGGLAGSAAGGGELRLAQWYGSRSAAGPRLVHVGTVIQPVLHL